MSVTGTDGGTLPGVFIFGSCVSRDTVEFLWDKVSLLRYVARQSVVSSLVDASGHMPPEPPFDSRFQERMRTGDISGDSLRALASVADDVSVILIDLCDERLGLFEVADNVFITDSVERRSRTGLDLPRIRFGDDRHFQLWRSSLHSWVAAARVLAPQAQILCVGPVWAEYTLAGIPTVPSYGVSAAAANALFERYYEAVVAEGITILGRQLGALSDDHHRWGPGPFHYSASVYQQLAGMIVTTLAQKGPAAELKKGRVTFTRIHLEHDATPAPPETVVTVESAFLSEQTVLRRSRDRLVSGAVYGIDGMLVPESVRTGGLGGDVLFPANKVTRPAGEAPLKLDGTWTYGGPWFNQFGHFVLETLTASWPVDGGNIIYSPSIFGSDQAEWQLTLMRRLGWTGQISVERGPVTFERLRIGARPCILNRSVSAEATTVWQTVAYGHPSPGRALFLSRSKLDSDARSMVNAAQLDAIFRDAGFDIIHPQLLPIKDQLQAVAEASVLAGPSGSALHLSAFAHPACRVIELGDTRTRGRPLPMQRLIDGSYGRMSMFIAHDSEESAWNLEEISRTITAAGALVPHGLLKPGGELTAGGVTPIHHDDRRMRDRMQVGTWILRVQNRVKSSRVSLLADGSVLGYVNDNEHSWKVFGGSLQFANPRGRITSVLRFVNTSEESPALAGRSFVNPAVNIFLTQNLERAARGGAK